MLETNLVDRSHCIETILSASKLHSSEIDKATESAMLQAFNSLVPRGSYLADYLDGAAEHFERAMEVDVVMPCWQRVDDARDEIAASQKRLTELRQQIKEHEDKLRAVRREVDYAKRQAAELAEHVKGMDDAMSAIRRVARDLTKE